MTHILSPTDSADVRRYLFLANVQSAGITFYRSDRININHILSPTDSANTHRFLSALICVTCGTYFLTQRQDKYQPHSFSHRFREYLQISLCANLCDLRELLFIAATG